MRANIPIMHNLLFEINGGRSSTIFADWDSKTSQTMTRKTSSRKVVSAQRHRTWCGGRDGCTEASKWPFKRFSFCPFNWMATEHKSSRKEVYWIRLDDSSFDSFGEQALWACRQMGIVRMAYDSFSNNGSTLESGRKPKTFQVERSAQVWT